MERLQVWGVFALIVLTAAQTAMNRSDPQPSYLLLGPTVLRAGLPTSVSVTILIPSSVTVSARIVHGNQTVASNSMTVGGGSTELLTLPPVSESESAYRLEVKGHQGSVQVFSNSTQLRFELKGFSTFIQTDKGKYLPGQVVKIRVVSIHPDGRPYASPVDVIIRDPRGNLLVQWLAADSDLGVVSKEFELTENPPLGEWTITTSIKGVSSVKHFTVAHYVLPRFKVVIDAPDVIYSDDTLAGSITAKYVYGKPVRGHMYITFIHRFHGADDVYEDDREIDGTEDFTFDVPNYHQMSKRAPRMLYHDGYMDFVKIVVHVTEHLTNLTYNSTTKVSVVKNRYKLSFEDCPKILRPSLTFTCKLKICTYDGQPLPPEDQGKMVQVSVTQQKPWAWVMDMEAKMAPNRPNASGPSFMQPYPESAPSKDMEFPVAADGVLPLHIEVMNDTETLIIDASFEDSERSLQIFRTYVSPSHTYLQIVKPSRPPQVGSPLQLHIQRNFQMADVHYVVRSRGQVVSAGTSSGNLTLVPEASWGPVACILVYCVHPSGEILNDVIQLPITQFLKNQVSLTWSSAARKPGKDVTLTMTVAEPGSLVGILVVDKATHWEKSRHDITKETVMKEMKKFSISKVDAHADIVTMGDPYSVFKTCDFVALTDASLHMAKPLPILPGEGQFPLFEADGLYMDQHQEPYERWYFPETWIWMDVNTGSSLSKEIPLTVPDSITSWIATAFVMSENLGLGVVEEPEELTVFQNFFLSLNLPAYVIRGEELMLEVLLFNYLQQPLTVKVIVAQSDTFSFVVADKEGLSMPSVHRVDVEKDSAAAVLIPIKPLVLGEIDISVKAVSSAETDFVRRTLLVKAEGLERSFSSSLLLELPTQSSISTSVTFTFPPDVVEGSQRVSVAAVGDILGPSISGLDSLIQMPSGCGEQNMINFAPNIYVLQYLSAIGRADQDATQRAIKYMMKGYQQELAFQRENGSFSAFGEQDSSGSTWLTAFVVRCFLQARPFITIDDHVLYSAVTWLTDQQELDGKFMEPGRVIHTALQGGLNGDVSLTAYVVIALLEGSDMTAQYESHVSSALIYLEMKLAMGVSNNYSLSLLTYALAMAGSNDAQTALGVLMARAETKDGVPMWYSPDGGLSSSWQPRSADIEMASYVLLTLHKLNRTAEGLGLMKWLSRQRNHRGGFGNTQDTVVALQALSQYAARARHHDFNMTVRVNAESSTVASFYINQENYLLYQSQQIDPEDELNLQVMAEGRGHALFQLNVFYNVRNEWRRSGQPEAFYLDAELYDTNPDSAHLYICTRLIEGFGLNATGMALMEVGLLSGFSLAPGGVRTDSIVKKVETPPGMVVLYLDSVTTEGMCLTIPLVVEYKVAKMQKARVVIYDYYEPTRTTTTTYKSDWRGDVSIFYFCHDNCDLYYEYYDYWTSGAPRSGQRLLLSGVLPALLLLFITCGM